jgi:4-aminobutyrate aminotransferase/(S)-3-amino-2-methylpropionate transaminase
MRDTDADLLADEARYCSFGDTVHYADPPKIFERCEGSWLYDTRGVPYLDLQMWYSAVNFGYANPRLNNVLRAQLDTLPQVASQYLHRTKIQLAKTLAQDAERKWGLPGRVHFNVGGSRSRTPSSWCATRGAARA